VLRQATRGQRCLSHRSEGGCAAARGLYGAFAVTVTPDGRFVYAAGFESIAAFARARRGGALRQLPFSEGCVSASGSDDCTIGRGLHGLASLVVSADGANLYAAASHGSAIVVFARDRASGALRQLAGRAGCLNESGAEGCQPVRALRGAFSVAVAPDGTNVYATGLESNSLVVLRRDTATGELTQVAGPDGCQSQHGAYGCVPARGLDGPNSVVVSHDGRTVYVASSGAGAIAVFRRDPDTGALQQLGGGNGCTAAGGTDGCATGRALAGAYGVVLSRDGTNAYATSRTAVLSFARVARSGRLVQLPGASGCISATTGEGCAPGHGLRDAAGIALTHDDRWAYVAASGSSAITTFRRQR
jgi:DNA-binding beta-propeller fold protein YncE